METAYPIINIALNGDFTPILNLKYMKWMRIDENLVFTNWDGQKPFLSIKK